MRTLLPILIASPFFLVACNPFGEGFADPVFGVGTQVSQLQVAGETDLLKNQCYVFALGNSATHPGLWPPSVDIAVEMSTLTGVEVFDTFDDCIYGNSTDRITVRRGHTTRRFYAKAPSIGSADLYFHHPDHGSGALSLVVETEGFNSRASFTSTLGEGSVRSLFLPVPGELYVGGKFNRYGATPTDEPMVKLGSSGVPGTAFNFSPLEVETIHSITPTIHGFLVAGQTSTGLAVVFEINGSGTVLRTLELGSTGSELHRAWRLDSTRIAVTGSIQGWPQPSDTTTIAVLEDSLGSWELPSTPTIDVHTSPINDAVYLQSGYIAYSWSGGLGNGDLHSGGFTPSNRGGFGFIDLDSGEHIASNSGSGLGISHTALATDPDDPSAFYAATHFAGRSTIQRYSFTGSSVEPTHSLGPPLVSMPLPSLSPLHSVPTASLTAITPIGANKVLVAGPHSGGQSRLYAFSLMAAGASGGGISTLATLAAEEGSLARVYSIESTFTPATPTTPFVIYLGGRFDSVGGQPHRNIVQIPTLLQ